MAAIKLHWHGASKQVEENGRNKPPYCVLIGFTGVLHYCVLGLYVAFIFTIPVRPEKMSKSYSSHTGYTMRQLCEIKFSQLL